MSIFRVVAGYTYGHADVVRRAMSKKKGDVLQAERESFLAGAEKNGVAAETAEKLFDDMASFANYAFNKSHAAAYAVISYRTAYLKRHYPCEYMAALLTSVLGNQTKMAEYIVECGKYGIRVLPPDINESRLYFHPGNGNIVFGLLALKNVGKQFVESILRERTNAPFGDFEDFVRRMAPYDLNKRMVEALIKAGAFDRLGTYRSQLLAAFEPLIETVQQKDRNNIAGQLDMFSAIPDAKAITPGFTYPDIPDFSLREKLMLERETSGMYFSGHLLDSYDRHVAELSVVGINEALNQTEASDRSAIAVAGIVTSVTVKNTKKNEKMAFFTLEDRYGEIECLAFATQYARFAHHIRIEAPLYVKGTLSVRDREEENSKILVSLIHELVENNKFVPSAKAAIASDDTVAKETKKSDSKPPEVTARSLSKVYLRVPSLDSEIYQKTRNLVEIFDGPIRVYFYDSSTAKYTEHNGGITISEFVLNELISLLGKDNVVPK